MKICNFCGYRTDDNSAKFCTSCGSKQFSFVCPNCSAEFEGKFCPTCGIKYDAVAKICPDCGNKYFTKSCPDCGYNANRVYEREATAQYNAENSTKSRGFYGSNRSQSYKNAVMALCLSIIGWITCMFPVSIIGFVMAVTGNKKGDADEQSKKLFNTTLILDVFFFALFIIFAIIYLIGMVAQIYNG